MIIKISCVLFFSIIVTINAQSVVDDSVPDKTCYTTDGLDGFCVPYYLCQNGKIITDGSGLFNIRSVGGCEDYFEECCLIKDRHTKEEIIEANRNKTFPDTVHECGMRNAEGILMERMTNPVNGESEYAEFPWMAAVLHKEVINETLANVYTCGGSLIGKNVILTAAHCVHGKHASNVTVRLGEWDSQSTYELFPHSDHEVDQIVIHEKYYRAGLQNDIALLFLKTEVALTDAVNTICLPSPNQPIDVTRCFGTGWGAKEFGKVEKDKKELRYPRILKKIELPTLQHADCQNRMRRTRLGRRFILNGSFMCAGGEKGVDMCKDDGGGPLVCPVAGVQNKYYQAGIVAWGIGCGDENVPGVYVNVAKFTTWINEKMALNTFDNPFNDY